MSLTIGGSSPVMNRTEMKQVMEIKGRCILYRKKTNPNLSKNLETTSSCTEYL